MSNSRSKNAIVNTISELLLEIVIAVCSFILPRLILNHFGSAYNGITSSISQFIGCIALLKSGIGGVTRAALYKPLAERNSLGISEVTNATSNFLKKIALVFTILIFVFATIYPLLVSEDFDWLFSFSLVIILSISTFAQYFWGLTYQMVLQADQKNYVISVVTIISTILNTLFASLLIITGFSIHIVKLASAIIFVLPPVFYNIYVKKKYRIDCKVKPNYSVISQRWDAFGHQVANFINTNTDIIVVTMFLGVKEVSVYSIYYMVANSILKLIKAFSTGTTAAFGNMLVKNEHENLKKRFNQYELLIFMLSTFTLIIAALTITPFVLIYTKDINDVNYNRSIFGYLICLAIYFTCIKLPYEQMVYAAGEFKNTRNGAFIEAIINIFTSVILVKIIGLIGVVIGTIIAISYRTVRYYVFVSKNIIKKSPMEFALKLLFSGIILTITILLVSLLKFDNINSYSSWIIWATLISIITGVVTIIIGLLMFRKDFFALLSLFSQNFGKRLRRKK